MLFRSFNLSKEAIDKCLKSQANKDMLIKEVDEVSKCIVAGYYKIPFDGQYIKVESNLEKYFLSEKMIDGFLAHNKRHIEEKNQDGFNWKPKDENQIANCLRANAALCATDNSIKIKSATSKGYEEATEGDSINFSVPNSETRRGRIGKGVAQTLDTACNQATISNERIRRLTPRECFRLMDFPDTFTCPVSDSQAYKQAGNSIVVNVLYKILKNLNL